MTLEDALRKSVEDFTRRVDAIGDDQWQAPTPCTDWDMRALVNHVTGEAAWMQPLLAGLTIADVGGRLDGDLLGDDPPAAWRQASDEALTAATEPGALDGTVQLSYGEAAATDYVAEVTSDVIVHVWDVARATGGDDRLDPELVDFAQRTLGPRLDQWRAAGAIGPALDFPPDADPQTRLLAAMGRRR